MKILFVFNTPGFLRYFDVTIDALLERGHEVALAFARPDLRPESLDIYEGRTRRPEILGRHPFREDAYAKTAVGIRAAVDYVRYLDRRFAGAEYLRNRRRTSAFVAAPVLRVLGLRRTLPRPLPQLLERLLLALEHAVPSAPEIEEYLATQAPDLVIVSPLVTGASPQTDFVKSARVLGIPCALCVASWDNLTNKGLMREPPDRVVVWNEVQRREAVEFHGVDPERVIVTGAQPFDRWFGRAPSCSREEFCAKVGISADTPFVMFVGSTSNISREGVEEEFVRSWAVALRAAGTAAGTEVGILVRPHPDRPGAWDQLGLDNVAVWPPRLANSVATEARTDYFDSLYHSAAVVGINTSAMIEAAIIGRPVLTVRAPQFAEAQEGTIHFQYLLPENGGFVRTAHDLDEHVRQVLESIANPDLTRAATGGFVDSFIRPRGRDRPANDMVVEVVEQLAHLEPQPVRHGNPLLARLLRAMVRWSHWRSTSMERVAARRKRRERATKARLKRTRRTAPVLVPVVRAGGRVIDTYDRVTMARLRHRELRRARAYRSIRRKGKAHGRKLLTIEPE